ncbi:MAG: hypothetical protein KBF32_02360 [Chitinophagales bacterium]|nr:hypothetical protein [Chitinophagaceae bacterium]MBP9882217.1 hypothetical protein [Chitinophagales bacterium]
MINVLFVDEDNGSRSRMAAAFLSKYGAAKFNAFSAGVKAGYRNAFAEEVMQEIKMNIAFEPAKDVSYFTRFEETMHYVIVLCNDHELKHCEVFPSALVRLHWMFENPVRFEGTDQYIIDQYRKQRDLIQKVVKRFIKELQDGRSHLIEHLNFEPAIR